MLPANFTSAEAIAFLESLKTSGTPVYIKDVGDPGVPFIESIYETYGKILVYDSSKFVINWDSTNLNKLLVSQSILPIRCVDSLMTKEEWESSERFKILANQPFKFDKGQLCYLSSKYPDVGDYHPRIGSEYERYGKILERNTNRSNTNRQYKVRWFLSTSRDLWYNEKDLVSESEYLQIKLKRTKQYTLLQSDPLVSDGTKFISDGDYLKAVDESIFISSKHSKLFK